MNNGKSQNRPASACNQSLPLANILFTSLQHFASCQHSVYSNTLPLPAPTFCLQKYPAIVSRQHFVYITPALRQLTKLCLQQYSAFARRQPFVRSNTRPLPDANILFTSLPNISLNNHINVNNQPELRPFSSSIYQPPSCS